MEKEPRFVGRNGAESGYAAAKDFVLKEWAQGTDLLPGEKEKSQEELELIAVAHAAIAKWLSSRDIPFAEVDSNRIHFLAEDDLFQHDADSSTLGYYDSFHDRILIKKTPAHPAAEILSTLVHEMLHGAHVHTLRLEESGLVKETRSGYAFTPTRPEKLSGEGFNEIVLVYTTFQVLLEAGPLIEQRLGITIQELTDIQLPYMRYADLLHTIAQGIARAEGKQLAAVYTDLVRGQFANTMLNLKAIEKTFGKGSLRVLASLMSTKGITGGVLGALVTRYFISEDPQERSIIRTRIRELGVMRSAPKPSSEA